MTLPVVVGLRADLRTWAVVDKALARSCKEGWTGPQGPDLIWPEGHSLDFLLCTMGIQEGQNNCE